MNEMEYFGASEGLEWHFSAIQDGNHKLYRYGNTYSVKFGDSVWKLSPFQNWLFAATKVTKIW